jgi:site-specific DNA-methyltransferase (adenine-specific)
MKSEVFNEDCMVGMKRYPDKFFDLAIVDPPYGIGVNQMNMGNRKTVRPDKRTWDQQTPDSPYFLELFRTSKNQIIWGGNYFDLPPSKCFIIWDKGETMYERDFAECEQAWASFDKPAKMYKKNPNQPERIHPTQKPVSLYTWLLKNYAKPGDKILDTHLGSGSSRIAAYDMGFDFYGWEIDKDYFEAMEKRFSNHIKQLNLFTNGSTATTHSTASLFETREDLQVKPTGTGK